MVEVMFFATVLSPIIMALVGLSKKTVNYPNNFVPLVAVVTGLVVGLVSHPFTDLDITMRLWSGVLAGLSGVGLFELIKTREGSTKE